MKHRHFIDEKPTEAERRIAAEQLRRMSEWAESTTCRRRLLLQYFDETFNSQESPCCDVCTAPTEVADYTEPARMFLSCAKRTGERFGSAHLIDVLRGSLAEKVRRYGHERLSTHGIGRDRSVDEWRHVFQGLRTSGYVDVVGEPYGSVVVTERGRAVLFDGEVVHLSAPRIRPKSESNLFEADASDAPQLFERLRSLRKRLADERGVPPYVIFSDATLRQMATERPTNRAQFLRISGVGEKKAAEYGQAFLALISETIADEPIRPMLASAPRRKPAGALGDSARTTLGLFTDGQSPEEIATSRRLSITTIEGHLAEAIEAGETVDLGRLVSPDRRQAIEAAIAVVGDALLAPIRVHLGEEFGYGEIRYVRAALRRAREQ